MFYIVAKPPFSPRAQGLKAMVPSRPTDSYDIANLFVCSLTVVWQLFVVSVRLAKVLMDRIGPESNIVYRIKPRMIRIKPRMVIGKFQDRRQP